MNNLNNFYYEQILNVNGYHDMKSINHV